MPGAARPESSVRAARALLGVPADADPAQLARAYRRQARRIHPDTSVAPDATERFWALQAAYRLALDAALVAARPDTPTVQTPTPVAHRDPTVVLGTPRPDGLAASRTASPRPVEWLLAGPVRVQPPRPPGAAPTSRGEPR